MGRFETGSKEFAPMRLKACLGTIVAICVLFSAAVSVGDEGKGEKNRPVAFFPALKYEFLEILEGTKVTHDFIVQNKGTAPLKVEKVKTD